MKSAGIDNAEGVGKQNGLLKLEGLPGLPPWCPISSLQEARGILCDVNTALIYDGVRETLRKRELLHLSIETEYKFEIGWPFFTIGEQG